ncbi:MAG: ComF family protein [Eubacterium sp.]|nr:ComF family protein [Eubacterium sp.]
MRNIIKQTYQILRRADEAVLDFIYPPRCPICDRAVLPETVICPECRKKITNITEPACMKCGKPIADPRKEYCRDCARKEHHFVQGKALWVYEKEVKASIYRFKYQNKREYARRYAAELVKEHGAWIKGRQVAAILPIPLNKNRKKKRGYHQAGLLAEETGKLLGIPVYTNVLVRIRDTRPQKTLNDTERKNNLKKAFKTTENVVQLKSVLLIDDIYTTGSTLDAAASVLLEAGVSQVYTCCISIGRDS